MSVLLCLLALLLVPILHCTSNLLIPDYTCPPAGFTAEGNQFYNYVDDPKLNQIDAEVSCNEMDSELANTWTPDALAAVMKIFTDNAQKEMMIGLTNTNEVKCNEWKVAPTACDGQLEWYNNVTAVVEGAHSDGQYKLSSTTGDKCGRIAFVGFNTFWDAFKCDVEEAYLCQMDCITVPPCAKPSLEAPHENIEKAKWTSRKRIRKVF